MRGWFVVTFFLLTLLPAASMLGGFSRIWLVDENRRLASLPALGGAPSFSKLANEADSWFTDHFGLRSLLIRLKTQIDYSIFATSSRIHVGSDGWMFYRSVMDVEKPLVEASLRSSESNILDGVQKFDAALKSKGIRLILTISLLADRFLPHRLPNSSPNLPTPANIDTLLSKIGSLNGLAYVDAPDILRRVQATRSAFHRTDFHWNDPAAFEVAREIVDTIGTLERRAERVWTHALAVEEKTFSGGIATFMPVFRTARETGLFVKSNWADPPGLRHAFKLGPFEWVIKIDPPRPQLLPTTVVVGDSFADGIMRSGFHIYFNAMYRLRWSPAVKLSDVVASLPPDTRYVVVQFIEVNLVALMAFANHEDVSRAVEILRRP